jgi:hypothetical protein
VREIHSSCERKKESRKDHIAAPKCLDPAIIPMLSIIPTLFFCTSFLFSFFQFSFIHPLNLLPMLPKQMHEQNSTLAIHVATPTLS